MKFRCVNFTQACRKFTFTSRVKFAHMIFKLSANTRRIFTKSVEELAGYCFLYLNILKHSLFKHTFFPSSQKFSENA